MAGKYILLMIILILFHSCRINNMTKNEVKENSIKREVFNSKLYDVLNPERLSSMLKECEYKHSEFYGERYKYAEYIKRPDKTIICVFSSLNMLAFVEDYNICFFEGKVIFIPKSAMIDENIFYPLEKDTAFTIYSTKNMNYTICHFDSILNLEKSEKFEPIFVD